MLQDSGQYFLFPAQKCAVKNRMFYCTRWVHFCRDCFWSIHFGQSWAFDWLSVCYKEDDNGNLIKIWEDNSTIRAFSKDDAFDTFVFVAEKIKDC